MRKHIHVLTAALALSGLFVCTGPAAADADLAVTRELVKLVTPKETYLAMIQQMGKQTLLSIQQSGAKLPPDAEKKINQAVIEALPYEDLANWTVEVYATRFTTDEIKQLTAFYKTPVGHKAAQLLPELSGEVGKKMGPILMQRMPAAMKKAGLM
jgi:hypothetical protein